MFQGVREWVEGGVAKWRPITPWIREGTWRLVDERTTVRLTPVFDQLRYHWLSGRICKSLPADRTNWTIKAGQSIEGFLKAGKLKDGCVVLQAWYNHAGDHPQKPSRQDLEAMTAERADLYRKKDPPGEPIPIELEEPFDIADGTPSDWEIAEALGRMPRGKSPGPTKMRAEHLKLWRAEAYRAQGGMENRTNWDPFVDLVQHVFVTGEIPTALSYTICLLLLKPDGGVRGLGLLVDFSGSSTGIPVKVVVPLTIF
jgi:hypothetical protein